VLQEAKKNLNFRSALEGFFKKDGIPFFKPRNGPSRKGHILTKTGGQDVSVILGKVK
jgi:phage gpG-like protein